MGSSRQFGTASELKLQRMLRQHETTIDPSQFGTLTSGDTSTRFDDYERQRHKQFRAEIDKKQEVCINQLILSIK